MEQQLLLLVISNIYVPLLCIHTLLYLPLHTYIEGTYFLPPDGQSVVVASNDKALLAPTALAPTTALAATALAATALAATALAATALAATALAATALAATALAVSAALAASVALATVSFLILSFSSFSSSFSLLFFSFSCFFSSKRATTVGGTGGPNEESSDEVISNIGKENSGPGLNVTDPGP